MIVFTTRYKAIGILGGMGPEATARFYSEIIRGFQKQYGAKFDSDYPEIIIYNLPLPDIVEKPAKRNSIIALIKYGLRKLEAAGADFIVAPCNTLNAFYDEMRKCIGIPVCSIVEETARKVSASGMKRVGILGTRLTLKTGLYDNALGRYGIETVKPAEKEVTAITTAILNILEGSKKQRDKAKLLAIINRMERTGAQGVVLGCTELPLLLNQKDTPTKLFDTLAILADFTVLKARIGRSVVEAAFWSVAPAAWVRVPASALNKNYLSQLRGGR